MNSNEHAYVAHLTALWAQSLKYDGKPLSAERRSPPRPFSEDEEHWGERNYFESLLDTAAQREVFPGGMNTAALPGSPFECYIAEQEKKRSVPLWEKIDPELKNWFANGGK
jgi:hypothetical protein